MGRTILGENIRALRLRGGLSKSQLAEQAKCSERTIAYIEDDGMKPNAITAVLIAKALGTTVEKLVEVPDHA